MNDKIKNLENRAEDLSFELSDGTPVVKLGVIATLYFKGGYTTDVKIAVMDCFRAFYQEFGVHLKGQIKDKHSKLTPQNFEKTVEKIIRTGPHDQYEWQLTSAANIYQAEDYGISSMNSRELHGDHARSYIKIVLPWQFITTELGLSRYNHWINFLSSKINAEHGYGGLSTILPYDFDSYLPMEFELAQQYLGLEVDSMPHSLTIHLIDSIKGVNWQTVLGDHFVQQLGGEDVLRQSFKGRGDVHIERYSRGLILRAGDHPQLGAIEDGAPPPYLAVNKIVKSLRIPAPSQLHNYSPHGNCFEKESTAHWYARFDREDNITTPVRVESGKPCPKEGIWFTPAFANSSRYFQQGELMPRFDQSDWGDTLWYWSGEN